MRPNSKRPDYTKPTRAEQLERREQITVLRYDLGLSEREIAKQLGLSLGRVSEELREIHKEFNRPLDPSLRDSVIQEHDRQHRQVMGKLWQCFTTAVNVHDKAYIATKVSECLARREVFLARVGFFQEAPSRVEDAHDETENLTAEAIERITEQFPIWQERVRARSVSSTNAAPVALDVGVHQAAFQNEAIGKT